MRNQESEIGFLGATAGLPSSALYHLFERALVLRIRRLESLRHQEEVSEESETNYENTIV